MIAALGFISLETLATILTVCAAMALVLAYTRTNIAKNTIQIQSQQIEAQAQRIKLLETNLSEANEKSEERERRIQALENSVAVLERMKSGGDAVEKLSAVLGEQLVNNAKKLDTILELLK